jgi:hypothetical protein
LQQYYCCSSSSGCGQFGSRRSTSPWSLIDEVVSSETSEDRSTPERWSWQRPWLLLWLPAGSICPAPASLPWSVICSFPKFIDLSSFFFWHGRYGGARRSLALYARIQKYYTSMAYAASARWVTWVPIDACRGGCCWSSRSRRGAKIEYDAVRPRTSLVQLFALLQLNFEEVVQITELRRFGGAPNGYPFGDASIGHQVKPTSQTPCVRACPRMHYPFLVNVLVQFEVLNELQITNASTYLLGNK